ncbi:large ribosomal subunit protein bL33m isoform X1 [Patagioenas fasciata]|uniref:large ribosomal subunit protein bL33m isoform X1 n=1 Tax=Patagioenas fasciata TaxID=372321 RepID=UPI003A99BD4A
MGWCPGAKESKARGRGRVSGQEQIQIHSGEDEKCGRDGLLFQREETPIAGKTGPAEIRSHCKTTCPLHREEKNPLCLNNDWT